MYYVLCLKLSIIDNMDCTMQTLTVFTGIHALRLRDEIVGVASNALVEEPPALLGLFVEVPSGHQFVPFACVSSLIAALFIVRLGAAGCRCERRPCVTEVVLRTSSIWLIQVVAGDRSVEFVHQWLPRLTRIEVLSNS